MEDQKKVWTFPLKVTPARYWKPTVALAIATAALVAIDPHDTPYFRTTKRFTDFNKIFSSRNTGIVEGVTPVAFYLTGLARRDSYGQNSGQASMEALGEALIVTEVAKNVTRRKRPIEIAPNGDFANTWFKAGPGVLVNRGSFVSGHTTGAFAIADVFAERYHRHHWVPWTSYGLAGLMAFSRVTTQNHFPSDVFAGASFGYSISHFVVIHH
jgi:membrane-associated phospholipid phosphatase